MAFNAKLISIRSCELYFKSWFIWTIPNMTSYIIFNDFCNISTISYISFLPFR